MKKLVLLVAVACFVSVAAADQDFTIQDEDDKPLFDVDGDNGNVQIPSGNLDLRGNDLFYQGSNDPLTESGTLNPEASPIQGWRFEEEEGTTPKGWTVDSTDFRIVDDTYPESPGGFESEKAVQLGSGGSAGAGSTRPNMQGTVKISWNYFETTDVCSNSMVAYDENNNGVLRIGSDNPQWDITDASGNRQIYSSNYQDWHYVEVEIDTTENSYTAYWTNTETGHVETAEGNLQNPVSTVRRVQYSTSCNDDAWIDNVNVMQSGADSSQYLSRSGSSGVNGQPLVGNIDMNSNEITGLSDPTDPQDAATQSYVNDNDDTKPGADEFGNADDLDAQGDVNGLSDFTVDDNDVSEDAFQDEYLDENSDDTMSGSLEVNTIDTGNGNYEIGQNLRTTDTVTFDDVTISEDSFDLGQEDLVDIDANSGLGGGGTNGLTDPVDLSVNTGNAITINNDKVQVADNTIDDEELVNNGIDAGDIGQNAITKSGSELDSSVAGSGVSLGSGSLDINAGDDISVGNSNKLNLGSSVDVDTIDFGEGRIISTQGTASGVEMDFEGSDNTLDFRDFQNDGEVWLQVQNNGPVKTPDTNLDLGGNNINSIGGLQSCGDNEFVDGNGNCETDDDKPGTDDFGNADDLDSSGSLQTDTVADNEIKDNTVDNSEIQNGAGFVFSDIRVSGGQIGMSGNDPDVIVHNDGDDQSGAHWSGVDGLEFRGDGNLGNMEIESGYVHATQGAEVSGPATINGNLDVSENRVGAGSLRIGTDSAAPFERPIFTFPGAVNGEARLDLHPDGGNREPILRMYPTGSLNNAKFKMWSDSDTSTSAEVLVQANGKTKLGGGNVGIPNGNLDMSGGAINNIGGLQNCNDNQFVDGNGNCETDDDKPGTDDFGNADDLDSSGSLQTDTVADNEIKDNTVDNTEIQNDDQFTFNGVDTNANIDMNGNNIVSSNNGFQIDFDENTREKAQWYGSDYTTGVESSTLFFESGGRFRWYANSQNHDGGTSEHLQLDSNELLLSRVNLDANGNSIVSAVDVETSNIGSGSEGGEIDFNDNIELNGNPIDDNDGTVNFGAGGDFDGSITGQRLTGGGANLWVDSGMESGRVASSGGTRTTAEAHTGSHSWRGNNQFDGPQHPETVNLKGGETYTISAWIKNTGSNANTIHFYGNGNDYGDNLHGKVLCDISANTDWKRCQASLHPNADTGEVGQWRLEFDTDVTSGHVYFDDIQLERGETATKYRQNTVDQDGNLEIDGTETSTISGTLDLTGNNIVNPGQVNGVDLDNPGNALTTDSNNGYAVQSNSIDDEELVNNGIDAGDIGSGAIGNSELDNDEQFRFSDTSGGPMVDLQGGNSGYNGLDISMDDDNGNNDYGLRVRFEDGGIGSRDTGGDVAFTVQPDENSPRIGIDTSNPSNTLDVGGSARFNSLVGDSSGNQCGADEFLNGNGDCTADSNTNTQNPVNADLVAGDGLTGGQDNVLPGSDSDITLSLSANDLDNTGNLGTDVVGNNEIDNDDKFDLSNTFTVNSRLFADKAAFGTSQQTGNTELDDTTVYVGGNLDVDDDIRGSGGDLAEKVNSSKELEQGEVAVIAGNMSLEESTEAYDTAVAGVISTDPGIVLAKNRDGKNLGLSGIVPVEVTTSNGDIESGDLLTTSNKDGKAMRCRDNDRCENAVIGKAMQSTDTDGKIRVLLTMG